MESNSIWHQRQEYWNGPFNDRWWRSAIIGISQRMPYQVLFSLDYIARPLHGSKVATIKLIPIASGKVSRYETFCSNWTKVPYCLVKSRLDRCKDNSDLNATIIGHTDNQGGRAYNQRLSEARAGRYSVGWYSTVLIQQTHLGRPRNG